MSSFRSNFNDNMGCVDFFSIADVVAYHKGELVREHLDRFRAHLTDCLACRTKLDALRNAKDVGDQTGDRKKEDQ